MNYSGFQIFSFRFNKKIQIHNVHSGEQVSLEENRLADHE